MEERCTTIIPVLAVTRQTPWLSLFAVWRSLFGDCPKCAILWIFLLQMSPKWDGYVGFSTNILDFLGYVGTCASKSEYDTYDFRAKRLYESRVMPFSVFKPVFFSPFQEIHI